MTGRRPVFVLRGIFRRGSGRDKRPICDFRLRTGPNDVEQAFIRAFVRDELTCIDLNYLRSTGMAMGFGCAARARDRRQP